MSVWDLLLAGVLALLCGYQTVYALVRLLCKPRAPAAPHRGRYGVLIAARNEEAVLGPLLDSIRAQEYPAHRIQIFVVADNCTDATAQVARSHGARVWERFDPDRVGKGYALQFLLEHLWADPACPPCDGYLVLDADNLLDPGYIAAMDRVFSSGARVVTGCRTAKNYGDNWLTAGYGLYFLRESEFMNRPRDRLGVSCLVSGTGFLVADSLLRECGGWNWLSLSEDTEFSADMLLRGEPIAYCPQALLYDEQPRDFRLSLTQRARWIRGYLQVWVRRGPALLKTGLTTGRFGCFDLLYGGVSAAVCVLIGAARALCQGVQALLGVPGNLPHLLETALGAMLLGGALSYATLLLTGLLTLLVQWRSIRCTPWKKLLYLFTYPLFMMSFALAAVPAVLGKAQWKPVAHTAAVTLSQVQGGKP